MMNQSKNHKCALCRNAFSAQDDVVVCPECGAPYHRGCYEKEKACLFADKHTQNFAYTDPDSPPQELTIQRCTQCGTENADSNIFCTRCGTAMHRTSVRTRPDPSGGSYMDFNSAAFSSYTSDLDGISTKDWTDFIGDAAPVYLYQFQKMDQKNSKLGFCWAALIFPPAYFFYRKMWAWAIGSMLLFTLLSVPSLLLLVAQLGIPLPAGLTLEGLAVLSNFCFYLNWGFSVIFLLFSTFLYRQFAAAQIRKIRQNAADELAAHTAIVRRGGTSIAGVIVMIVLAFAFSAALLAVFAPQLMFGAEHLFFQAF